MLVAAEEVIEVVVVVVVEARPVESFGIVAIASQ